MRDEGKAPGGGGAHRPNRNKQTNIRKRRHSSTGGYEYRRAPPAHCVRNPRGKSRRFPLHAPHSTSHSTTAPSPPPRRTPIAVPAESVRTTSASHVPSRRMVSAVCAHEPSATRHTFTPPSPGRNRSPFVPPSLPDNRKSHRCFATFSPAASSSQTPAIGKNRERGDETLVPARERTRVHESHVRAVAFPVLSVHRPRLDVAIGPGGEQ